jgi:glutamyl-tRNA reductase
MSNKIELQLDKVKNFKNLSDRDLYKIAEDLITVRDSLLAINDSLGKLVSHNFDSIEQVNTKHENLIKRIKRDFEDTYATFVKSDEQILASVSALNKVVRMDGERVKEALREGRDNKKLIEKLIKRSERTFWKRLKSIFA